MAENTDPTANTESWLKRMLSLPNESIPKTLFVAISLCLVCSVMVSATAVVLRPLQEANQRLDRKRNILAAAEVFVDKAHIEAAFAQIETRFVDLATGEYVTDIDPAGYEQRAAARDPERSIEVAKARDIAGINRRAKIVPVYLVKNQRAKDIIILPVRGYGLWSTMYGYLALEADANTIAGIKFYDHAETPGLGGEIDNPDWQEDWKGKALFDAQGQLALRVVKGTVDPQAKTAKYQVDGLAGATLTSNGVTNMIRYWVGADGFGPYLDRLRQARGSQHG